MINRKRSSLLPLILIVAGGLLLVFALVILKAKKDSPSAVPTLETIGQAADESDPEIERVSLADAKAAFDSGSAVFLDVRAADVYAASHVAGAQSIPWSEIETRLNELDPNQWIIPYCT
jgi:hypothetical protein